MGYSRSRARCVPLQYPSSATRGVKLALNINKQPLNQSIFSVSTPSQEKKNISSEALISLKKDSTEPVSLSESGMFYELSNRRRMECEKYQDCSWFQQSPVKSSCNSKYSLAENFDPFIDADEFDLTMHFANAQTSPWGDEYMEMFTDDILLKDNYSAGERNKNNILNENFHVDSKRNEDNAFDSCNINFSLKKTDSVDSMKNISYTNPAEIIPISYKERLNNSNYGLTKLGEIKTEVKKEVELYSPESNSYLVDSDDSELNIGREEIVEEMSTDDVVVASEKATINLNQIKNEMPLSKVLPDQAVNEKNNKINNLKVDDNNYNVVKSEPGVCNNQTSDGKLDLNLDISKLNFEPSLNVNTPDLDFMDLVEFINEEMRQENGNSTDLKSTTANNFKQTSNTSQELVSNNNYKNNSKNVQPNDALLPVSSVSQNPSITTSEFPSNFVENSTVDFNEISSTGVSIAERIKTSAKRKSRKSVKDLVESEAEESRDSSYDEDYNDDEDEDDDDYDYKEEKRRCAFIRKRSKSSVSESSGDGKKLKEESSSYRERRDKNNEASRRSRQNRKARERHMYETLEEEEKRNVRLKAEADVLEKQVTSLRQLLLQVVLRKGGAT